MTNETTGRVIRVGIVGMVFAMGFLCGSVTHRRAEAQLGGSEKG